MAELSARIYREPAAGELRWTGRDVVILLVLGGILGVIYALAFVPLSVWLYDVTGQNRPLESLINGIWLLGGFIPMAVIRKPGALLLGECIAAFVEVSIQACPLCAGTGFLSAVELQNEAGQVMTREVLNPVFFSGVLQGAGGELLFCLTRYVRWDLSIWLLAGLGSSIFSWASGIYVTHSYIPYDGPTRVAILISSTIGMTLLAGGLGWYISRRLHRDS